MFVCTNTASTGAGHSNQAYLPGKGDTMMTKFPISYFGHVYMHVQNKKYGNFVSISHLTGKYAAQKFKNFRSSSRCKCLHHIAIILKSQNKITDFLMISA